MLSAVVWTARKVEKQEVRWRTLNCRRAAWTVEEVLGEGEAPVERSRSRASNRSFAGKPS